MRWHRNAIMMALWSVAACTPSFDFSTYAKLSEVSVYARDMAERCPAVTAAEIHDRLVLPAKVAAEEENGRKFAEDLEDALGHLVASASGMEAIYRSEAKPSQAYCLQKLNLIVAEVGRIKAGFAKVEHGNTPLSP